MKNKRIILPSLFIILVISYILNFTDRQLIAIGILSGMILSSLMNWHLRLPIAFIGLSLFFLSGSIGLSSFIKYTKMDIIAFLLSMMIFIAHLDRMKFFEGIIQKLIIISKSDIRKLVLSLILLSALSAALVDEVTSILFMTTIILSMCQRLQIQAYPFVLLVIFATNIGSSATVVGNPVGVMISFEAGLGFMDFIRWSAPVAIIGLLVLYSMSFVFMKKYIQELENKIQSKTESQIAEKILIQNKKRSIALFLFVILGLIFHGKIENLLGLEKNSMLLGIGFMGAGIALYFEKEKIQELIEKNIEWKTLVFFLILFSGVGALKETSVIDTLSQLLVPIMGENLFRKMSIMLVISGLMSSALDNVIAIAILIPIVQHIGELIGESKIFALWWMMLIGGTYIGNLTPIGSTANIVALGLMEKTGLSTIQLGKWFRYSFPVVLVTTTVAFLLLGLQFWLLKIN